MLFDLSVRDYRLHPLIQVKKYICKDNLSAWGEDSSMRFFSHTGILEEILVKDTSSPANSQVTADSGLSCLLITGVQPTVDKILIDDGGGRQLHNIQLSISLSYHFFCCHLEGAWINFHGQGCQANQFAIRLHWSGRLRRQCHLQCKAGLDFGMVEVPPRIYLRKKSQ